MSERVKWHLAKAAIKSPGIEPRLPAGGLPHISWEDVMKAMEGCHKIGGYICLAKYARDSIARAIAIKLLAHCILARGEKRLVEQDDADKLSEIIVDLEVEPGLDRCPKCQGRKTAMSGALTQDCKRCEGAGRIDLSARRLSIMCDIEYRRFYKRDYKSLITHYQAQLGEWETSTLYRMDARLYGPGRVAV